MNNGHVLLLSIGRTDHIFNPRDENCSVRCDQLPQDADEVCHGFVYGPAKVTRVKVAGWAGDFNKHVCETTEAVGDTWSTGVEPVVIRLKVEFVIASGPPEEPRLTIQIASTPWNQPSFPLACSTAINSSRPTLPLSSIPSNTKRRFTGSSIPKSLWASRTLSHPRMGPLSSDDPRPMSRPSSAIVKLNGLVSQPSLSKAWIQNVRFR